MERLSGLDASFLYFETSSMHMHVVAVSVHDPSTVPGGYSFDRVKETIESRLHLLPTLRRRLAPVPFNIHHPVWVEDPDFDLDYHIRRIGCPAPGGEEELAEIAGDIASRPLDRSRPLWEMWMVEGLEHGYVGTVTKMHHSTTDGVSGANLLVHLLDTEADATPKPPEKEWQPDPKPSDASLIGHAVLSRARRPLHFAEMAAKTAWRLGSLVTSRLRGSGPGMAAPLTAPRTSFNQVITPHRKIAFSRIPLEDVKSIKRAMGTTVNDVVLTVAAGALRRYLEQGNEVPVKSLMACVPVSVRTDEEQGTIGSNKVSALFSTLHTDVSDPIERLQLIHEANKIAKEEHKAIGADMLQGWAELAAPMTFSMAARLYSSMRVAERHPVIHNLVISNVPGPQFPLYFSGAKLVELFPLGPIFDGAALNITVLSYMDTLHWGFMTSPEAMPRIWDLAHAVPEALMELQKAVESSTAAD